MSTQANTDTIEIISAYTPSDALKDGIYIDVVARLGEDLPKQAGFTIPVYFTNGVWADLTAVPETADWQSEKGRAWDILTMSAMAVRMNRGRDLTTVVAHVSATHTGADSWEPELHTLLVSMSYDRDMGPHIIIMWPNER